MIIGGIVSGPAEGDVPLPETAGGHHFLADDPGRRLAHRLAAQQRFRTSLQEDQLRHEQESGERGHQLLFSCRNYINLDYKGHFCHICVTYKSFG